MLSLEREIGMQWMRRPHCRATSIFFSGGIRRLPLRGPRIAAVALLMVACANTNLRAGTDVFLEAGIAASDREWTGPDYAQAAEILATGKVPLPQESDEIGRALVRRMTSLDNLKLFRDSTLPIESRFANYIPLINGANSIFKLYLASL